MGNSVYTKFQYDVLNIPSEFHLRQLKNYNYCTLVENIPTRELYEQYIVYTKQNKSIEQQLKIYQFRRKQNLNLVKVHFVQPIQQRNFCVGHHQLKIYTEHIQLILKDLSNINLDTGIYMMQAALKGFKAIYKNFGYVNLNDAMIGINNEKKVKVWLNSNFALNNTQNSFYLADQTEKNKQISMVQQIFEIIQEHLYNSPIAIQFKNDRIKLNRLFFDESQVFLLNFAQKYNMIIPNIAQFHTSRSPQQNVKPINQSHQENLSQNKLSFLRDPPHLKYLSKNQSPAHLSRVKITVSNLDQFYKKPLLVSHLPFQQKQINQIRINNQPNKLQVRSTQNLISQSQIHQNQSSQIFVKRPTSFKIFELKEPYLNQFKNRISNSIIPNQSIEASTIAQKHQYRQINSLSPDYSSQKHFGSSLTENIQSRMQSRKPSEKQINQKRKIEIEQAEKYFANVEKNLAIPPPPKKIKNLQKEYKSINIEQTKTNTKQKIAKIIANVKQSQTIKQLDTQFPRKKQSLEQNLEQNQQYFFKNNFLDYQKYKKILQTGNTGELKQSITFEQLGNKIPIPNKIQQEVKLLKLQKLTGRREISKSLTPEDQFLYTYQPEKTQTKIPNEIKESSEFHENQY